MGSKKRTGGGENSFNRETSSWFSSGRSKGGEFVTRPMNRGDRKLELHSNYKGRQLRLKEGSLKRYLLFTQDDVMSKREGRVEGKGGKGENREGLFRLEADSLPRRRSYIQKKTTGKRLSHADLLTDTTNYVGKAGGEEKKKEKPAFKGRGRGLRKRERG